MRRTTNAEAISQLNRILDQEGVRAAVAYLNSLTEHRFTSLYQFQGDTLHNVIFFDRQNPTVTHSDDIPVMASYCVFVRDAQAKFITHDSGKDERVQHHPKRDVVQSYCGVPLLGPDGAMFGTICHFDFLPGRVADIDVALLETMAYLLPKSAQRFSALKS
jgi:GAF domain-containing protein